MSFPQDIFSGQKVNFSRHPLQDTLQDLEEPSDDGDVNKKNDHRTIVHHHIVHQRVKSSATRPWIRINRQLPPCQMHKDTAEEEEDKPTQKAEAQIR